MRASERDPHGLVIANIFQRAKLLQTQLFRYYCERIKEVAI